MKPVQKVLIGGNYWEIHKLTPKISKKFIKYLKQDPNMVTLRGFCEGDQKRIYIQPGQHPENFLNCLLHEGLHAILMESCGYSDLLHSLNKDEEAIHHLTGEILNFFKQTMNGRGSAPGQ
jgi:hypothetical protein